MSEIDTAIMLLGYIAQDLNEKYANKPVSFRTEDDNVAITYNPRFRAGDTGIIIYNAYAILEVDSLKVSTTVTLTRLDEIQELDYKTFQEVKGLVLGKLNTKRKKLESLLEGMGFEEEEVNEYAGVEEAYKEFEENNPIISEGVYHTRALGDFKKLIELCVQQGYAVFKEMREAPETYWNFYSEDTAVVVATEGLGVVSHLDHYADEEGTKVFSYHNPRGES